MRFLLFIILASSLAHPLAQARMEGCEFKVTIHTAFTGPGADEAFSEKATGAVEKYWNRGFKVGECACAFHVEVKTKIVGNCSEAETSSPEYHCITVHNTSGVFRSQVFRSDFTRSLSETTASTMSGTGQMEAHDSDATIAHEFGHLMGLEDEYEDQYMYYVYDNGTGKYSGPHYVRPSEYTDEKARELQGGLSPGQSMVFQKNNYGTFLFPVQKNGTANNSLMASVGGNASVMQSHVDAIFAQCAFSCPDKCCCGNSRVDERKGEECDPKASPQGCVAKESCTDSCKCVAPPRCGDGKVNANEQCDYKASPDGCGPGYACTDDCACEEDEPDAEPPTQPPAHPPMTFTVTITNPADGSIISSPEPVLLEYSNISRLLMAEYFMDGRLVYRSQDQFAVWSIVPGQFGPGAHQFLVRAYDIDWNNANDSVGITIG